jgi:hypothetical protein
MRQDETAADKIHFEYSISPLLLLFCVIINGTITPPNKRNDIITNPNSLQIGSAFFF